MTCFINIVLTHIITNTFGQNWTKHLYTFRFISIKITCEESRNQAKLFGKQANSLLAGRQKY